MQGTMSLSEVVNEALVLLRGDKKRAGHAIAEICEENGINFTHVMREVAGKAQHEARQRRIKKLWRERSFRQ